MRAVVEAVVVFCRLVLQGMLEAGLVLLGCVMPALPDVEDDVRNTSFASQSPSNSSSSSSSSRGGDSAGGDDDSGMGVFMKVSRILVRKALYSPCG